MILTMLMGVPAVNARRRALPRAPWDGTQRSLKGDEASSGHYRMFCLVSFQLAYKVDSKLCREMPIDILYEVSATNRHVKS